jgi:hypothetical protein
MSRFKTVLKDVEIIQAVEKHGTHDQKTHGNWATGGTLYTSIIDRLGGKDVTGFSLDISSRKQPTSGYMASNDGAEKPIAYDEFFSSRDNGRKILLDYIEKNADALSERGAYFGIWVVKDQGTVYLDVSRRYDSRGEGVRAGFSNKQQSIYDIDNDAYIYMKDEVDDRTNKAVTDGSSNSSQSDDGRRKESLRGGNSQRDRKKPLTTFPHVCIGRYTAVQKHLQGLHDQATHGAWASGRYPEDSVKAARDGAKEYLFQKGLKGDDTIDYTKIVANRERASQIADLYENLPKMDRDAVDEYEALASEVEEQFDYMTKVLGVKVEFVADDPYKTSKEMFEDVSKGSLKVLSTATTGAHPLFSDEQNDKFRAVHDYFGHAATGRGFGQDGEESAWVHHSQMFTEKARGALTTETRGQNSFFNNRGKQFADQKVALLPPEFWQVPKVFVKTQIIRFAPGLKPVFKHQEHDQSSHGNWARGVSAEDEALINEMDGKGPSLDDLENALKGNEQPDLLDLVDFVNNDSVLYQQATEDIDARVEERLAALQAEFPLHEYTEQEKATIYEDVQRDMIDAFIDEDDGTIAQLWQEQNGEEFNPEDLHGFMDEVFGVELEVKNSAGEQITILNSATNNIYLDGSSLVVQGQVADADGNFAGEFQRSFFKSQDKEGNEIWAVEHDLFKLEDEYAGVGFGSKFIAQQEAWYVAVGIGRVDVGTAWDGARHWAKSGFDFNDRYMEENVRELIRGRGYASADFEEGSENRAEFDSLISKMVNDYNPVGNAGGFFSSQQSSYSSTKPIDSEDFPIPNDFLMIGYADRFETGTNQFTGKPVYSWAGARLLDGLHMKYQKGLSQEGRTINQGPIDRDGDGLVYDGTPREKPASTVN